MQTSDDDNKEPKAKKTKDWFGPILAWTFAILAVIVIVAHVYLAIIKTLDPIHTLLLNLLAIVFTSVCTIWIGRVSALRENKSFIRAALRTTFGLWEELKTTQQTALDVVERMELRTSFPANVQGDFWQEGIGRVVDQINALMRRAQETVDNWQELGPEEVERLTSAELQKELAINELRAAAQQVTAVWRDLANSGSPADTAHLRTRLEALESERRRLEASSALTAPARGEARKLLAMGALEEAVDAYSSLIDAGNAGHTTYLARARARYLAGDRQGALEDLKKAEAINPADAAIQRLRRDIEEGRTLPPVTFGPQLSFKHAVNRGNAALASGDGQAALEFYEEALEGGLYPALHAQNRAMALLLMDDPRQARLALEAMLDETTGPFVRIQALALLAFCAALENTEIEIPLTQLAKSIRQLINSGHRFDLNQSPLQFFIVGLRGRGKFSTVCDHVVTTLLTGVVPTTIREGNGRDGNCLTSG